MPEQNMSIHLVAGGLAGATGTILTCPLEVIKTRFQASSTNFHKFISANQLVVAEPAAVCAVSNAPASSLVANSSSNRIKLGSKPAQSYSFNSSVLFKNSHLNHHHCMSNGLNFDTHLATHQQNFQYSLKSSPQAPKPGTGIYLHFKFIVQNEGYKALFKGLGPNLVGVAPYRAIYFFSYANSKKLLAQPIGEERPLLHVLSAFVAGFSAVSITNPIWFVKTRLQLDETRRGLTTFEVANKILKEKGVLGFYKGISASYFGIAESAIYFSIYEKLKSVSKNEISINNMSNDDCLRFLSYFTSAGVAKTMASCLCYPHEVARTRLRQEGNKYTGFFQTLGLVVREEGFRGLYKGMATHLIRQIPNTAIVMTTYELIVSYFQIDDNSYVFASEDE